jgi:lysophospholipase L1-like esterase
MPIPPVMVIAPPPIGIPAGPIAPKFDGAAAKSEGLADAYRALARELGCHFFDAGTVTGSSRVDGVHLDADQHLTLGDAMVGAVHPLLV